jgi:hypothetical protein
VIYTGFYRRLFEQLEFRMVWLNAPPGGVYRCAHPRKHPRKRR